MALAGRTRSTRGLVIVLVTVSLATITIDYREGDNGPLAKLGDAALAVITPLQKGVTAVTRPIGRFFTGIARSYSLEQKVEALEHQVRTLQNVRSENRSLRERVEKLQSALEIKNTLAINAIGAQVIASGVSNLEWSVEIDVGSSSGVHRGMAVMADGALAGMVTQVAPDSAKVTLIVDPSMQIAGRLVGSSKTGQLTGQGLDDLTMDFIDEDTVVDMNEPVETAGYNGSAFPGGIPIGHVSRVTGEAATGQKQILVHPSVDFSSLDIVLVVLQTGGG